MTSAVNFWRPREREKPGCASRVVHYSRTIPSRFDPSAPLRGSAPGSHQSSTRYCCRCALRALEIVIFPIGKRTDGKMHLCDRNGCGAATSVSIAMGPGNGAQARFPDRTIIKREAARARLARDDRSASTHSVVPTSCMAADQPSVLAICGDPLSAARAAC